MPRGAPFWLVLCFKILKKLLTPTLRNSLEYTYREEEKTMMTVNEVCKLTGVSIRTLQYYDTIGLLKPIEYTKAGYRLYDDTTLERLQQILLFKELEFSLKEIIEIIDAPDFDRDKALTQQIELLTMKKEHLEGLIDFAREIKTSGVNKMNFEVFDTTKMDEYAKKAKEEWGQTEAYKEYIEKTNSQSEDAQKVAWKNLMLIFVEFGKMKEKSPSSEEVQLQVKRLQDYISENFYNCTNQILKGLGEMYVSGGEFTENIDKAAGSGAAVFAAKAIEIYCR